MKNTKFKLLLIISCMLFVNLTKANDFKSISFYNSEKNELLSENEQQTSNQKKLQVNGQIKDTNGDPIVGASVVELGTTNGTATDRNGNYTLNVSENGKLNFTYVGYAPQTIAVDGKTTINVNLSEDLKMLDELVVIGYGTVRKSDLTGSVSSVNSARITEKGRTNVINSMQGSVAGVQITQNSSRANAPFDIIIRGQNSVSGSTAPLYVVDGVITSNIDFLNPQDIEKIDILKDASSTAIYGSRGSHGVVIVQTKSGQTLSKDAKPVISYDGYYGTSNIARMPNFMDTSDWMKYRIMNYQYTSDSNNDGVLEFAKTDLKNIWMGGVTVTDTGDGKGLQPIYPNGKFSGSQWLLDRYLNNTSTDWLGLVSQTGIQQNHYIDVSGSSKNVSYVVGIGVQDEKGVFVNDRYTRYNLKGSVMAQLNEKWSAGFNINTALSTQEEGSDNAMVSAFRMSPIVAAYDNGTLDPALNHLIGNIIVVPGKTTETTLDANNVASFNNSIGSGGFTSSINPLIDLANVSNNTRRLLVLGSTYLQFSPLKNLQIKTTLSPSINTYRNGKYISTLAEGNYDNPLTTAVENDAKANIENGTYINYTWDNQINYRFKINEDHNFDLMGLHSMYSDNTEIYNVNTAGYSYNYYWYNLGAATNTASTKLTSGYSMSRMMSYAARLNYSYKNKYLVTTTWRTDGSSRFNNKKWDYFPSVALAWRASEESFMQPFSQVISNLKFRVSLGYTGNNNINPYQTSPLANLKTYYNFGTTNAFGVGIGSLGNANLTWEKTREFNAGLDLGLWNNRIDLTVDVYNRLSEGLLQARTLPLESGAGTMTDNLGAVSNRGVELGLSATPVQTKDFTWTINGTFAANQNRIENLFGNKTPGYIYINSNTQKWMVGEDITSIYGYVFDGVWTASDIKTAITNKDPRVVNSAGKVIAREGQARVKDFDGNGIDAQDRRIQGHANPNWTAGFSTNVYFKGFDLGASLYTAQGMTVFSPFIEEFTNYNDRGRNKLKMEYYIPAGTTLLADDGSFYTQETAVNYQGRPMVYTDNGSKANSGPYWHQAKETANEMPGSWVNSSFAKVRNITLGYTLPKNVANTLNVNKLRVYCNVVNPFVFTSYEGFDPEWAAASMGKDNGPATITYQFGVNLKF